MKAILILLGSLLWVACSGVVWAQEAIQSTFKGLTLNASWRDNGNQESSAFLILHGTWATHNMEIISTLQSLLDEEAYTSLAITLSLGIDDRTAAPSCEDTLIAGQNDNLDEINHWLAFMQGRGFDNIILVGHSRGGTQMASFNQTGHAAVKGQALVAPMVWLEQDMPASVTQIARISQQPVLGPLPVLICESAMVTASAYQSYYSPEPEKNTPTLLQHTQLPTLVFLGSEDKLGVKFLQQQHLFEHNPQVSIHMIEGADHFFRDLYADDLIEQLLETFQ